MCETKKRLVAELQAEVRETERPMRWRKAEIIARKFSTAVLDVWQEFTKKLLKELPTSPTLAEVLESDTSKGFQLFQVTEKKFTPQQVEDLGIRLRQSGFPAANLEKIEALFEETLDQMMVNSILADPGVFNTWFEDAYKEGLNKANEEVWLDVEKQPKRLREFLKNNISPVPIFNSQSQLFKAMSENAFNLVKAKISVEFKGLAFQIMQDGIDNGDGWMEIARTLNKNAGTGAGWHWKRLVRTEMTGAFDRSSTERYAQTGVKYVKFSPTAGACSICTALNGWWVLGTQPDLPWETHPNCRCRWLPKFNLSAGVQVMTRRADTGQNDPLQ